MKVSSWQISFRRARILDAGVRFDELMGAGTGNGAEEELKFLTDCEKAGLRIYYVPALIASVAQTESTWFHGYTETFFENRGATTRYILGSCLAALYAVYFVIRKRSLYRDSISPEKPCGLPFAEFGRIKSGSRRSAAEMRAPTHENTVLYHPCLQFSVLSGAVRFQYAGAGDSGLSGNYHCQ